MNITSTNQGEIVNLNEFVKFYPNFVNQIISKLNSENAKDHSDSELDRCFDGFSENKISLVKKLRDAGLLIETQIDIKPAIWPFQTPPAHIIDMFQNSTMQEEIK